MIQLGDFGWLRQMNNVLVKHTFVWRMQFHLFECYVHESQKMEFAGLIFLWYGALQRNIFVSEHDKNKHEQKYWIVSDIISEQEQKK